MEPAHDGHQVVVGVSSLDVVQHHRKNVGTDAGHTVVVTAAALDTVGHHAEHVVAEVRGERIVDGTEAVDIQKRYRKGVVRALGRIVDVHLELLEEELAVVDPREGVLVGVEVVLAFDGGIAHAGADKAHHADRAALFVELGPTANGKFLRGIRGGYKMQGKVEGAVLVECLAHLGAEQFPVRFDNAGLERIEGIVHFFRIDSQELCDAVRPVDLPRRHVECPEAVAGSIDHHLEHFVLLDEVLLEVAAGLDRSLYGNLHVVTQLLDVGSRRELVEEGQIEQNAYRKDVINQKENTAREIQDFRNESSKNNTCKQQRNAQDCMSVEYSHIHLVL